MDIVNYGVLVENLLFSIFVLCISVCLKKENETMQGSLQGYPLPCPTNVFTLKVNSVPS